MQQQDLHSCIGAHHGVQEVDPLISVGPKAGLLEEKRPTQKLGASVQTLPLLAVELYMPELLSVSRK